MGGQSGRRAATPPCTGSPGPGLRPMPLSAHGTCAVAQPGRLHDTGFMKGTAFAVRGGESEFFSKRALCPHDPGEEAAGRPQGGARRCRHFGG